MTQTASYIHKQDCVFVIILRIRSKSLYHGVEAFVHPATLPLTVSAHIVVEMLKMIGSPRQPREKWFFGVVRVLERPIGDVPRVLIFGLFEISRHPMKGWACNVEASVG